MPLSVFKLGNGVYGFKLKVTSSRCGVHSLDSIRRFLLRFYNITLIDEKCTFITVSTNSLAFFLNISFIYVNGFTGVVCHLNHVHGFDSSRVIAGENSYPPLNSIRWVRQHFIAFVARQRFSLAVVYIRYRASISRRRKDRASVEHIVDFNINTIHCSSIGFRWDIQRFIIVTYANKVLLIARLDW